MADDIVLFDEQTPGWQQAFYAFLAEKERRSGSHRTVESYSRMLQHFFGSMGKPLRRSFSARPACGPSCFSPSPPVYEYSESKSPLN